ncbi:MAG: DUF2946 family protein [Gammaproteobacteria bacterium]|nr:DUF2946 family protein [Gammaproteobacteria bacterium]
MNDPPRPDPATPTFDESVRRAMAKWPNVPECYGWLGLDPGGRWLLQGAPLTNANLIAFIGRNYACDAAGRWFMQNGPQRVFVELHYTPWVFRIDGTGTLVTHTGLPVGRLRAAHVDADGHLLLAGDPGIGLLDSRDLATLVGQLRDTGGRPLRDPDTAAALERLMAGADPGLTLVWEDAAVPVTAIGADAVPARYGFVRKPQAPGETDRG